MADRIQRSVAIMERLIRDLLDFASFEDGRLQVAARPQDVRSLVHQTLDIFQPLAAAKSLSLEADLPEGPVVAAYDHNRMLQVVSNVLQNAIKFTPEGGSVRVRVVPAGGECVIAVTDTGIGIPEEELGSVFERFKQLSGERGGLGLGLYISKWIVEAHGGRIWADSLPGAGTTFSFTLPRPS
jgi:signal transduction histidine kinase